MNLLSNIKKEAIKNPKRIIFCEPDDKRISSAIKKIKSQKLAEPILLKKDLNSNLEKAKELILNKECDAIITGATHPTSKTIKLAIELGTKKNIKRISGAMLMIKNAQNLLFSDCAANFNPDKNELAEITVLANEFYKNITKRDPNPALLSYSTLNSAQGESAKKVRAATKILKKNKIRCIGEVQIDAALIKKIYTSKGGKNYQKPNIFIFPNLDAANIGYKLVERFGDFKAIGPILLGCKYVVNDLSRGCSVNDIINLSAISSIQKWIF